ncbi:MAG: MBL fold metallo-hydrolase [candidate division KSB1 bacterium]|nr:MBL fold metallo-hydrolase [candidate division KSB1 bacterium]
MVRLTVLGSGSCVPNFRRSAAAYHLSGPRGSFFVDLGAGALRRATESGIPWAEADAVLLSHFHMDHFADLLPYLFALKNTPGLQRGRELVLAGPVGLRSLLTGLAELLGGWVLRPGVALEVLEMESGSLTLPGCRIEAARVQHSRGALGFRFEMEGVTISYSGDTGPCEEVIRLCQGAQVAILECAAIDEPMPSHLTPEEAGEIARQAGVELLLLSHFYPSARPADVLARCRRAYAGTVLIAEDLLQLALPSAKENHPPEKR